MKQNTKKKNKPNENFGINNYKENPVSHYSASVTREKEKNPIEIVIQQLSFTSVLYFTRKKKSFFSDHTNKPYEVEKETKKTMKFC